MLKDYETDHDTGMDFQALAEVIHDYTSGYPFLVSRICKLMDERICGTKRFPSRVHVSCLEGNLLVPQIRSSISLQIRISLS